MLPFSFLLSIPITFNEKHCSRSRFWRAIDEFERRYIYEALTFAFIGMLILLIGEAFLESFGFSRVPGYGNAALMLVLWSVGLIVSSWRRHWRYE